MKIKNKRLYILLPVLVCGLITLVYSMVFVFPDDRKAPEIQMDSDILEVSVTADDSALMQGVTAQDNKDGDVTATMLVEGISRFTSENTAIITYAAYDAAGNVAKRSRTIKYTDYQPPRFGQTKALVFSTNTAPDVLEFMSATDVIDGDISNRIKGTLVSDTTSLNYAGVHQVEFRITNSMGDTQYITLPVEVYDAGDYNAKLELSEYLVYIKAGQSFDPDDYLENIVVGTTSYPVDYTTDVDVKSDVDTSTPGIYSVAYTVEHDNRYTAYTRLNVVVEE